MSETFQKFLLVGILFFLVFFGKNGEFTLTFSGNRTLTVSGPVSGSFAGGAAAELDAVLATQNPLAETLNPERVLSTSSRQILFESTSTANIFLVSYLDSSQNMFDLQADKRWPIASLTKLMTALIAEENIAPDREIIIGADAVAVEGSGGDFRVGERFKPEDLIKALLAVSSNDAAYALANFYGKDRFVEKMNQRAAEIGMADTFFKEPTGLSSVNQSTANDLKLLVRYLYNHHRQLFLLTQKSEARIFDLAQGRGRILRNINSFAGRPDFIGGKTGFTDEAGENLISLFSRNNRVLLLIVMDAKDRFNATLHLLNYFDDL